MISLCRRVAWLPGSVLVCILSMGCPPNTQAQAETIETWIARGDSAYRAFDNETALRYYARASQADSADFIARLRLSRTHYDFGLDQLSLAAPELAAFHFREAVRHACALVESYPDSARAHFLYAATLGNLALFEGGREKIALGRLVEIHSKRAIALDPTWAYPYVALGIYYREIARLNWLERALARVLYGSLPEVTPATALSYLEHAERLRPDFPFLHFEMAMTYDMLQQEDKMIEHLRALVALEPETTQDIRNQETARRLLDREVLTAGGSQ